MPRRTLDEGSPLIRKISENGVSTSEKINGGFYGSDEAEILLEGDPETPSSDTAVYHCHAAETPTTVDSGARRTLLLAALICLLFMLAEIVGGVWAGSLAIITDAAHLLTDFASFLISLFSLYVASRPPTQKMSFGWHRAEVVGAFISVLMIWVVTGVLVYMAVERLFNQDYEINAVVMLVTAGIGVCVNLIMGALLYGSGHGHSHGGGSSHGHSHGGKNINVRAAFIHVLGDLVQSIGVLIAAAVIYFYPKLSYVDPICTFIFSILVLVTTVAIMRDALNVLMEGSPKGHDFGSAIAALEALPGVRKVHNLRIWALTMNKVVYSVHLSIEEAAVAEDVLSEATGVLQRDFGVFESTVQIERWHEDHDDCAQCETPKS